MKDLVLNAADTGSPLWRSLSEHMQARLATLREKNDAPKTGDDTAFLRGQIAEIKAFLSLAEDRTQRRV